MTYLPFQKFPTTRTTNSEIGQKPIFNYILLLLAPLPCVGEHRPWLHEIMFSYGFEAKQRTFIILAY